MIYLVPEAKACRSRHGYESGSTRSKKRPRNIGIDFGRLVQVMEGEREKTQKKQRKKEKKQRKKEKKTQLRKQEKMRHPKQEKEEKKRTVDTRPPE